MPRELVDGKCPNKLSICFHFRKLQSSVVVEEMMGFFGIRRKFHSKTFHYGATKHKKVS